MKDLRPLAQKYVWWKPAEEAVRFPHLVAAQVMNIGDHEDVQVLIRLMGEPFLRSVLTRAEIGMFSPRSWAYWHYRLGVAEYGRVPPLPQRKVA